jgi:hypothetical protein
MAFYIYICLKKNEFTVLCKTWEKEIFSLSCLAHRTDIIYSKGEIKARKCTYISLS